MAIGGAAERVARRPGTGGLVIIIVEKGVVVEPFEQLLQPLVLIAGGCCRRRCHNSGCCWVRAGPPIGLATIGLATAGHRRWHCSCRCQRGAGPPGGCGGGHGGTPSDGDWVKIRPRAAFRCSI